MVQVSSFLRVGGVRCSRVRPRVNNSERSIVANFDSDPADSSCLGDDERDDLARAAAIAQVWTAALADARQDIYTPDDGHPTDGGDVRPPSAETTANDGPR
jgi:hypothetical protein